MPAVENLGKIYAEQGVLPKLDIFTETEINAYREAFDELEAREGKEKCQIGLQARHFDEEFIWKLSADPRILDLLVEAMGKDVLLLSTHFFCKYPDPLAKGFVAWHQDVTYWGLEPPEAHTAWIAIDDSDVENGCMRVIPGSHRNGIVTHAKSDREGNLLSINQEIPDEYVDTTQAIDLELKAGQMSIHDGQLFHASMPNRSNRRRCGLTVRFIPPKAKQVNENSVGQRWRPILVRGEDRFKHYNETPAPFPFPR
ncbi:MAG: phytanoyl-CoA dioxygenase family protein [bacterium]|nr:phytanoyl-CoA dioxygenase family protein [bacterium]